MAGCFVPVSVLLVPVYLNTLWGPAALLRNLPVFLKKCSCDDTVSRPLRRLSHFKLVSPLLPSIIEGRHIRWRAHGRNWFQALRGT
jgi:hypothetical protein